MIITPASLSGIYRSFKVLFNKTLAETKTQWKEVAMYQKVTSLENNYAWLGDFPTMREWIGDRIVKNLRDFDYTIKNKPFEATIAIPETALVYDQIGLHKPRIQQLAQSAEQHKDILLFSLLNNGFSELCYDGQNFFDTDHPVGGASVSNTGGGSGTAWFLLDLSRIIKPMIMQVHTRPKLVSMDNPTDVNMFMRKEMIYGVDDRKNCGFGLWQLAYGSKATLNDTNYSAARAAMMNLKNDHGTPLGVMPTHLVYPPSLESAALTLLNAQFNSDGSSNIWYKTVKPLMVPWLV